MSRQLSGALNLNFISAIYAKLKTEIEFLITFRREMKIVLPSSALHSWHSHFNFVSLSLFGMKLNKSER